MTPLSLCLINKSLLTLKKLKNNEMKGNSKKLMYFKGFLLVPVVLYYYKNKLLCKSYIDIFYYLSEFSKV